MPAQAELHYACVSLAPSQPAARQTSGNPLIDRQAQQLARDVRVIRGGMSAGENELDGLCRGYSDRPDSPLASVDMRRCRLFFSILRKNQGSVALCKQAREMGIADENFGCAQAMSYVDGRSARCTAGGEKCRELAALVEALRTKDPRDCSASPFCKVLSSRDSRDCAPYLTRANTAFCGEIAPRAALQNRLEQVRRDEIAKHALEQKQARQAEIARSEQVKAEVVKKASEQRRFKKGEPMQTISSDILKRMEKIEAAGKKGGKP